MICHGQKNCVVSAMLNNTEVPASPTVNPPVEHIPEGSTTGAACQVNCAKRYAHIVTLYLNNKFRKVEKYLKELSLGIKINLK